MSVVAAAFLLALGVIGLLGLPELAKNRYEDVGRGKATFFMAIALLQVLAVFPLLATSDFGAAAVAAGALWTMQAVGVLETAHAASVGSVWFSTPRLMIGAVKAIATITCTLLLVFGG